MHNFLFIYSEKLNPKTCYVQMTPSEPVQDLKWHFFWQNGNFPAKWQFFRQNLYLPAPLPLISIQ